MSTPTLSSPVGSPTMRSTLSGLERNGRTQPISYPDSDGQPMADNTKQFEKIVSIHSGFDGFYKDDPNVFVAGDLLWYPVEGNNTIRAAPDVMLVFGRPKGHRGSYKQWEEENIAPQVVFEVLSPVNRQSEMAKKLAFYERYDVEEYYLYDPDSGDLTGWLRTGQRLEVIDEMQGWVSPRTRIRFMVEDNDLMLYRLDGQRFETYRELLERAEQERVRAEQEHMRAEEERVRAEQERIRAEQEYTRAERLAAQLRALGIEPESV